jgi:quercetin dioxygenase-like cupin family protein
LRILDRYLLNGGEPGCLIAQFLKRFRKRHMRQVNFPAPHLFRIAPGATSGGSYHHDGEECVNVISGTCEFWLDEVEHYVLKMGDTLYFSSAQAHRWSNPGTDEAVLLWINTPATF